MTHRRLALGTVQFGMAYGVANATGRMSLDAAAEIVATAREAGLDTLDTAVAYGESEQRLGEIGVAGWRIVSKLPPMPDAITDVGPWVRESILGSLARLRVDRLDALLLHAPRQLLDHPQGDAIYRGLDDAKRDGLVGKIGASVYTPDELATLRARYAFDIVQVPFSVVDRRFLTSGTFDTLVAAGVEVHVRSIFLQGLLLMQPAQRPPRFERWQSLWERWERWLAAEGCTALDACVQYAKATTAIDRIVVGVDTVHHLREILRAAAHAPVTPPADLACDDEALVNPATWKAA